MTGTTCSVLLSLPHARGGVSHRTDRKLSRQMSSPRPWGCFRDDCPKWAKWAVFPTPVGVFPGVCNHARFQHGLPHARGGVSDRVPAVSRHCESSPRPWGCFCAAIASKVSAAVFPTPVGVFLGSSDQAPNKPGLPHARGGVSSIRPIIRTAL